MNALKTYTDALYARIATTRDRIDSEHAASKRPAWSACPLTALRSTLLETLKASLAEAPDDLQISLLDRKRFKADICIKSSSLLSKHGNKKYIGEIVPAIAAAIKDSPLAASGAICSVAGQGIYVNLLFSDSHLFSLLGNVLQQDKAWGTSDVHKDERCVVDYSAPNVAKHLHAGHIRSTILGQVLCNLYQAAGSTVFGVNHINDHGGFGFLLEGYRRWQELLPAGSNSERLNALYSLHRSLERIMAADAPAPDAAQLALLAQYFGQASSLADYRKLYQGYVDAANKRFESLEHGDAGEVELWAQMVKWSFEEFDKFYQQLGINIDFTIGESFYLESAMELVKERQTTGQITVYTAEMAAAEKAQIDEELTAEKISSEISESLKESAQNDVGSVVVPLANHRRMIVLRSDGRSVYATRDLATILFRAREFSPTRFIYQVGIEQREHFADLFEAARRLELLPAACELKHSYHAFYINAENGQKLSSREGASNVRRLISATIEYFVAKYNTDSTFSESEKLEIAQQLAIGSIIFNDIRKDMKSPVPIQPSVEKAIEDFEKSGGAYVVYSACRARSILRKWGKDLPAISSLKIETLEAPEIDLIKLVMEFPDKVAAAARTDDPALLCTHLAELSRIYNSYYSNYPVIKGGEENLPRLVLTAAVQHTLENGLRICHIQCPARI